MSVGQYEACLLYTSNPVNDSYTRLKLCGLLEDVEYTIEGQKGTFFGDELMNLGILTSDATSGEAQEGQFKGCDFDSRLYKMCIRDRFY